MSFSPHYHRSQLEFLIKFIRRTRSTVIRGFMRTFRVRNCSMWKFSGYGLAMLWYIQSFYSGCQNTLTKVILYGAVAAMVDIWFWEIWFTRWVWCFGFELEIYTEILIHLAVCGCNGLPQSRLDIQLLDLVDTLCYLGLDWPLVRFHDYLQVRKFHFVCFRFIK